jgi:glycerol-3-phosphate acyltransferase PlsY
MTPLVACLGYLLGSIPFAFLFARRARGIDLRLTGSGNVGAANVLRTTTKAAALWVTLLDVGKGAAAVMMARMLQMDVPSQVVAGIAAVVGHMFPVWLGFKGGKGVATSLGVFAPLAPTASLVGLAVFALILWRTRFVSLGSMSGVSIVAPVAWLTGASQAVWFGAMATSGFIIFRHRANLARLLAGTEPRIGERA